MTADSTDAGDEQPATDGGAAAVVDESPEFATDGATATDLVERGGLRDTVRGTVEVAAREYRLAVRRRWAVGAAVVFALFSVALVVLGGSEVGPTRVGAVLASFAQVGVYVVPLVALAAGYDAIVGADESGSLEMLLALPLSNLSVVVGKYAGRAAAVGGGMLVGFAVGGALLVRYAGVGVVGAYAWVALVAVAAALAFLGVGVLASALASEKTRALGAALAAWVWFVLVHDLVALGAVASFDLPQWVVSVAVLANPADLFRVLVLRTVSTTAGGIAGVLTGAGLSQGVLLAALAAWILVPVTGAVVALGRRSV
ncbi:ABC transporter permease [Halobacterium sp. NMX12-1]|uniref:ABC transporter permease n=1 Tax=Halobacterium sp. NMX12-1 TaxID=3166650 RepID=A0AAU8CFJ8_9EURY